MNDRQTDAQDDPKLRAALAAADAARATAGVARLQPDLWGVVQQVGRDVWHRATGRETTDTAGIGISRKGRPTPAITVEVGVLLDGSRPALDVVTDLQHAVADAVTKATTTPVSSVAVYISEIRLS